MYSKFVWIDPGNIGSKSRFRKIQNPDLSKCPAECAPAEVGRTEIFSELEQNAVAQSSTQGKGTLDQCLPDRLFLN